jgi:hypothetical protein
MPKVGLVGAVYRPLFSLFDGHIFWDSENIAKQIKKILRRFGNPTKPRKSNGDRTVIQLEPFLREGNLDFKAKKEFFDW